MRWRKGTRQPLAEQFVVYIAFKDGRLERYLTIRRRCGEDETPLLFSIDPAFSGHLYNVQGDIRISDPYSKDVQFRKGKR